MSILTISNFTRQYENRTVVDDISLVVGKGEIVAIVGESGSGKTTLLNMISGNVKPETGHLFLENQELDLQFDRLIKEFPEIKLVPQDYRLKPEHKIWENIDLALTRYTHEYRRERVMELLELCGLTQVKDKKPREVSGGEKQRTAIARAIAEEPQVLLLDEPFSNLDSINKQKLREKLVEVIRQEEIACLFVTHDLMDAFLVADRIGVMYKGKLLQLDKPEVILKSKQEEYVSKFVSSALNVFREFFERYPNL
ncbi:iron(III) transport system ATP-binding protein [Pseudarcicella hirudinis]|uniref:Iron(III) transport system ATP-binding protein n=1 Tax=Pseudarcicella hirudinis TaxID=1079859 RepID=A0A1I5Y2L9_9BACT|nr:ABC transporter ATP-binding protein [Pseudarcicella hirudinis]SFQ38217.1 iron(III) transport system ATP-binding protein [Pseudarcicella hirudinis]